MYVVGLTYASYNKTRRDIDANTYIFVSLPQLFVLCLLAQFFVYEGKCFFVISSPPQELSSINISIPKIFYQRDVSWAWLFMSMRGLGGTVGWKPCFTFHKGKRNGRAMGNLGLRNNQCNVVRVGVLKSESGSKFGSLEKS